MLRQFLVGGSVSLANISVHALIMTMVVGVAQTVSVKKKSHPSKSGRNAHAGRVRFGPKCKRLKWSHGSDVPSK
jgi:hypothetical protein